MPTDAELARALLGIKIKPDGWAAISEEADRAWAYHKRKPYPRFAFRNWKTEALGPLPICVPTARKCVRRGARFLFGKGVAISCAGNTNLETFLRDAWTDNNMPARMVAVAERGGIEGGVVLKFAYDPNATPQLSIQTLSLVEQVRLFYHPHDRSKLLMARVQYPYFDPVAGARFWYREEWTAEEMVVYQPVKQDDMNGMGDPDTFDKWVVATQAPNPFGLIPLVHIKNLETDGVYGAGDLWELWDLLDGLNLVWYQMKRSNQFDSELNPWIIDGELDEDAPDGPVPPGQAVTVNTATQGDGKQQARVVFPAGGNGLRGSMMEYARELKKMLEEAAGSSTVDAAEVTNKGNLTQAVLTQLYQVSLETQGEKQKSYGQDGIEPFLEAVAKGLQRHGVAMGVTTSPQTWNVEIAWPAPFDLTNDEKQSVIDRVQSSEAAGYTTHERAVEAVAQVEGVRDVPKLKAELTREPQLAPAPDAPATGGAGAKQAAHG